MAEFITAVGIAVASCLAAAGLVAVLLSRHITPAGVSDVRRERAAGADWRRSVSTQHLSVWTAEVAGCCLTVKASSAAAFGERTVPASVSWSVRSGGEHVMSGVSTHASLEHPPRVAVEVAKVAAERCARRSGSGER